MKDNNNICFKIENLLIYQKKLINSISSKYEKIDEVIEELHLNKYLQEINFPNENLALELKCVVCFRIKNEDWKIKSFIANFKYKLIKFCDFLNKYYPYINSILEISYEQLYSNWENYLDINGIDLHWYYFDRKVKKDYKSKTSIFNFPKTIYNVISKMLDNRYEWEKDRWNVLEFKKYGIEYNKDFKCKTVNFSKISQVNLKEEFKVFLKEKLLVNKEITWNTLRSYLTIMSKFFKYLEVNNIMVPTLSAVSQDLINQYENELISKNKSGINRTINTIATIVNSI